MLYAPWLTSCLDAVDEYRKVAHMQKNDPLAALNCEANHQNSCAKYGQITQPTELPVFIFVNPAEKRIDRFRGRISAENLVEYISSLQAVAGQARPAEHPTVTQSVSCGNHRAASCAECPQGNGAAWCKGDCIWLNNACQFDYVEL